MGNSNQNRTKDEIERVHKALEAETQRCLELQRQLDGTNAEFEEFVSMAAHNLRQSLRDVASFSQLIAETSAGRLDGDAGAFLDHIRDGAASMQSLLADVVDYWATGLGDGLFTPTEMEAARVRRLRNTNQDSVSSDSECHRVLRYNFSARSHFSPAGGSRLGILRGRQRSWY
jgi:light-regulated signal transduction histidine kinase (bacteriophytochrome)